MFLKEITPARATIPTQKNVKALFLNEKEIMFL